MSLTLNILDEVDLEERSRGQLYHFTSFTSAVFIFWSDTLIAQKATPPAGVNYPEGKSKSVSFTRIKSPKAGVLGKLQPLRLEFDQDKLRTKYKIEPFSHGSDFADETEERVYKSIRSMSKYLVEVRLVSEKRVRDLLIDTEKKGSGGLLSLLSAVKAVYGKAPKFNSSDKRILGKILKEYNY